MNLLAVFNSLGCQCRTMDRNLGMVPLFFWCDRWDAARSYADSMEVRNRPHRQGSLNAYHVRVVQLPEGIGGILIR